MKSKSVNPPQSKQKIYNVIFVGCVNEKKRYHRKTDIKDAIRKSRATVDDYIKIALVNVADFRGFYKEAQKINRKNPPFHEYQVWVLGKISQLFDLWKDGELVALHLQDASNKPKYSYEEFSHEQQEGIQVQASERAKLTRI